MPQDYHLNSELKVNLPRCPKCGGLYWDFKKTSYAGVTTFERTGAKETDTSRYSCHNCGQPLKMTTTINLTFPDSAPSPPSTTEPPLTH